MSKISHLIIEHFPCVKIFRILMQLNVAVAGEICRLVVLIMLKSTKGK